MRFSPLPPTRSGVRSPHKASGIAIHPLPADPTIICLGGRKGERPYQPRCFYALRDERFSTINAPGAAGKTTISRAIAVYKQVRSGFTKKIVFCMPNTDTGDNYVRISRDGSAYGKIQFPDSLYPFYHFSVAPTENFCEDSSDKLNALEEWLRTPADVLRGDLGEDTIGGSVALVTYACLGRLFNRMWDAAKTEAEREEMRSLFRDTIVVIDEAHRMKGVYSLDEVASAYEQEILDASRTQIGHLCQFLMECDGTEIILASATMYTSNASFILSPAIKNRFVESRQSFREHYELAVTFGCQFLGLAMVPYANARMLMQKLLRAIIRQVREGNKVLLTVPSISGRYRGYDDIVAELIQALKEALGDTRFLDMVDDNAKKRKEGWDRIHAEPKVAGEKESAIDVIVVCQVLRMGSDWPPCNIVHNTACEDSLPITMQTLFRMTRLYEGKKSMEYYHYVQAPQSDAELADYAKDMNNLLVFTTAMEIEVDTVLLPHSPPQAQPQQGGSSAVGSVDTDVHPPVSSLSSLTDTLGDQAPRMLHHLRDTLSQYPDFVVDADMLRAGAAETLEFFNFQDPSGLAQEHLVLYASRQYMPSDPRARSKAMGQLLEHVCPNIGALMAASGFDYTLLQDDLFIGRYHFPQWDHLKSLESKLRREINAYVSSTRDTLAQDAGGPETAHV